MLSPGRLRRYAAILLSLCAPALCVAQAAKGATDHTDSRVDVYGGYGYFHPLNSGINHYQYQDVSNPNATASVSVFFTRFIGVQAEGGYFSGNAEHAIYNSSLATPCTGESCSQLIYTAEGGPVVRFPLGSFVPFVHALGGGAKINGPTAQPLFWGWGVTGGVGVDYVLSPFHHRFAVRAQGDWQYSQVVYGPLVLPAGTHGGFGEIDAIKLSGGLVARFGETREKPPVMLGCSVAPLNVFPGDPLKISGNALNTNPKLKQVYIWTSTGGKILGTGLNPGIDTTGLKAGQYIVKGHVTEGSKARQQADCEAPFTIRGFEPPTIACSASPSEVTSGDDVAISTTGGSPQNRSLTYSYSSSAGVVASNGPTAKLTTAGLSAQTITINCNVVDDLGQNAQASTTVSVKAVPVPVIPSTRQLCGLAFLRDKRRPTRVDNEAKGCLDDIALTLNKETDANLVIVGNYEDPEKEEAGAERTLNARQYLVQEKGIDASRITLRVGGDMGKTATDTLIPAGAVFNDIGTHLFDESTIVRKGQAYGVPHAPTTKKGRRAAEHAAMPVVAPAVAPAAVAPDTTVSSPPLPTATPAAPVAPAVAAPPPAAPAPTQDPVAVPLTPAPVVPASPDPVAVPMTTPASPPVDTATPTAPTHGLSDEPAPAADSPSSPVSPAPATPPPTSLR